MIDIGRTKQLFADDELIDSMTHAFQVLNPDRKHPANPLIVSDRAWEESPRLQVYGTALHASETEGTDRFRIWYVCRPPEYGDADHAGLLLAPGAPDEWDCGSIYTVNRPVVVGDRYELILLTAHP